MAISIKCPNGHVLKVKDEFAGKSGLCPHCHSRVFVPMPVHSAEKARISDDEILGLLGPPREVKPEPPPPPRLPQIGFRSRRPPPKEESGISLLGSSIVRNRRYARNVRHLTSVAFTHCPRCGTPLPDVKAAAK